MTALADHRADDKPADSPRGRWSLNSRFLIGAPGNPMMERWRLIQTPLFGIYVHRIYREDLDPVPHDHPWRFWSLILRGGYNEVFVPDTRMPFIVRPRCFGQGIYRRAHGFGLRSAHRITYVERGTVTLVIVGRKVRSWGFYDDGGLWIDFRDALGLRPVEGARSTGKYPR